ncbi:thiamine phosphate synthase [Limibacillus halophilus]|uniref:Thiamine-phosphate pyrophosphorylase n=1 Tax=Limibacillus halophilus TaxID=1579333 RepID=A0A839SSX0_9PROT|nr:thiamine phosphate synthase [Limibacillus halophilus]MBB3064810.1 thiamine-phosphate pyrophosphorylase [Limibacillus halophilus]
MSSRLYLATPLALVEGNLSAADFLPQLEAALAGGDIAAVLLRCDSPKATKPLVSDLIALFCPLVQKHDGAFLVEGFLEEAQAAGCDGVQVSGDGKAVQKARDFLDDGAIVGAACGGSRHDAMVAGESGADYVVFGDLSADGQTAEAETLAWWQETMLLPSVAAGAHNLQDAERLAQAGADFILLGEVVWDDPDGPASVVAWFERQLGE